MNRELINAEEFEFDSNYPDALERLIALNLINFDLWYLMKREQAEDMIHKFKSREKEYKYIPFARRGDNEDVACFDYMNREKVVIFKQCDYLGYHPYKTYNSVWDWFRDAIELMIAF